MKKINLLSTALLTGTMLLSSAGLASAATANCTPVSNQKAPIQQQADFNLKQTSLVKINTISRAQLSSVLNHLAAKGTITKTQAHAILSQVRVNHSITRNQLYYQLNKLVAKGKLSKAQMTAIMKSLPKETMQLQLPDKNKKDLQANKQSANQKQLEQKGNTSNPVNVTK